MLDYYMTLIPYLQINRNFIICLISQIAKQAVIMLVDLSNVYPTFIIEMSTMAKICGIDKESCEDISKTLEPCYVFRITLVIESCVAIALPMHTSYGILCCQSHTQSISLDLT